MAGNSGTQGKQRSSMENERFNMSLRKYLKHVGVAGSGAHGVCAFACFGLKNLIQEALGFATNYFVALAYSRFEARAVYNRDMAAMVINQSSALQT
jgi:hypothetical protein